MGATQVSSTTARGGKPQTLQTASSSRGKPPLSAGQSPMNPIDLTGPDPPTYSYPKKRSADAALDSTVSTTQRPAKKLKESPKEKRLAMFRKGPSQEFRRVYERALSQRFYVLNRKRRGTEECPGEEVEMTGSTGNVYTVIVAELLKCNCPHAMKGHRCKHIIYVLSRVLNAPFELIYQVALVPSELRRIFANAPPLVAPSDSEAEAEANKRKPVEGDCPICFCEFTAHEDIVWCRAACGQNIHKECFAMWARTKTAAKVTCPFCRSAWQGDGDTSNVSKEKGVMDEGYVNVADQLGISRVRDTSTYSSWMDRSSWGRGRGRRWY